MTVANVTPDLAALPDLSINEGDFIVRATVSERSGELPTSDPTVRHPRVWAQAVKWF